MNTLKFTTLTSACLLAFTMNNAHAFSMDLSVLNGGAGPAFADPGFDVDRIFSTNEPFDEMQFQLPVNTITLSGFDFGTAAIGDSFSFTDVGEGSLSAPVPGSALFPDTEGYLSEWEISMAFSLLGTATVTSINAGLGQVEFDFVFSPGVASTIALFYDTTVDGIVTAGSEQVLAGQLEAGDGNADQTTGSVTPNAGRYNARFLATDLLDGFWLKNPLPGSFTDNFTIAFADGNINDTVASYDDIAKTLTVVADSDGSVKFSIPEPASLALLGIGLLGLGRTSRRNKI